MTIDLAMASAALRMLADAIDPESVRTGVPSSPVNADKGAAKGADSGPAPGDTDVVMMLRGQLDKCASSSGVRDMIYAWKDDKSNVFNKLPRAMREDVIAHAAKVREQWITEETGGIEPPAKETK